MDLFVLNSRGHLKKRESYNLEYKQSFQLGDNLLKYIKTLVGMANNKGGKIVFGIKDRPHLPIGNHNNRFNETDPAKIDQTIREYFSQELIWQSEIVLFKDLEFPALMVEEAVSKPILCKKNKDNILREGAIYYRYRAETKEVEFAELKSILDFEKEKEKRLWMEHIQKIAQIGPQNIILMDSYNGEFSLGKNRKIFIDKDVVKKINFIKEGHFEENHGAPTLKLVGDVVPIDGVQVIQTIRENLLKDYPFSAREVVKKIKGLIPGCKENRIYEIIKNHDIKNNTIYSTYNFRNKKQMDEYESLGVLPKNIPSIYNANAIDFILETLKK